MDGQLRECPACKARHRFFDFPYIGRRAHSPVRENIVLPCRSCRAPMMDWSDADGGHFSLVLEGGPEHEGARAAYAAHEAKAAAYVEGKREQSTSPRPHPIPAGPESRLARVWRFLWWGT